MIHEFQEYGLQVLVVDPYVSAQKLYQREKISIDNMNTIENLDCLIIAVAHDEFKKISISEIGRMFLQEQRKIVIDVKGIRKELENKKDYIYWSL